MHSRTTSFTIGEVKFYNYDACDTHGSRCNVFIVNGQEVKSKIYFYLLEKTLKEIGAWYHVTHIVSYCNSLGSYHLTDDEKIEAERVKLIKDSSDI